MVALLPTHRTIELAEVDVKVGILVETSNAPIDGGLALVVPS